MGKGRKDYWETTGIDVVSVSKEDPLPFVNSCAWCNRRWPDHEKLALCFACRANTLIRRTCRNCREPFEFYSPGIGKSGDGSADWWNNQTCADCFHASRAGRPREHRVVRSHGVRWNSGDGFVERAARALEDAAV